MGYGAEGEPVLPSTRSNTASVIIGEVYFCVDSKHCFHFSVDIPQLPSNLLTSGSTFIMVSWMQPLYSLSNYTLSRTPVNYCLAHLQLKDQLLSYQVLSVLHTFSSIGPGSSFTISVEAGIGMSNTVSSTTNTSAWYTNCCKC